MKRLGLKTKDSLGVSGFTASSEGHGVGLTSAVTLPRCDTSERVDSVGRAGMVTGSVPGDRQHSRQNQQQSVTSSFVELFPCSTRV